MHACVYTCINREGCSGHVVLLRQHISRLEYSLLAM